MSRPERVRVRVRDRIKARLRVSMRFYKITQNLFIFI